MIGILGGTFDPIHYGHLRTALDVWQTLGLDEVRFIPLRDPPHRRQLQSTPEQRMAMVQTAIQTEPAFVADDREIRRAGKSYTLDTLLSLRKELEEIPICLLIGSDAFRGFTSWRNPNEILELAHLVVMQRPGEVNPNIYPERVTNNPKAMSAKPGGLILFYAVTQLDISATDIREMLQHGRSPRYLLPDPVLEIIREQQLYR